MRRRSPTACFLASAVFLLLPALAFAEREQTPADYTKRIEARLVLLDVSVRDSAGRLVSGLNKDNFRVLENGQPQKISAFDNHDEPVTVGILIDESASMSPKRTHVLAAAQTLIEESNPRDEVFVLNFNDKVTFGLPAGMLFSDDPKRLRAALHRGRPQGKTALNDAVISGLERLEQSRQDKKTLILISDGGDNASTHRRQQMLDGVERSLATIYTVGLFDPEDSGPRSPALARSYR